MIIAKKQPVGESFCFWELPRFCAKAAYSTIYRKQIQRHLRVDFFSIRIIRLEKRLFSGLFCWLFSALWRIWRLSIPSIWSSRFLSLIRLRGPRRFFVWCWFVQNFPIAIRQIGVICMTKFLCHRIK